MERIFSSRRVLFALAAGLACAAAGCQPDAQPTSSNEHDTRSSNSAPRSQAEHLLDRMQQTYRSATSYADVGELKITVIEDNETKELPSPTLSVTIERPNKFRVHAYSASVVSDGEQLRASIDDLEDQVLLQPAPKRLSLEAIFPDPTLAEVVRGQLDLAPPQLDLLVADDGLERRWSQGAVPKQLSDEKLDGTLAHRIEVDAKGGKLVYWIDPKTSVLRRLDLPSDDIAAKLGADPKRVKFQLSAVFKAARLNQQVGKDAFDFDPRGAKLVRRFVPPPPRAPSPILGSQPEAFAFRNLAGDEVTRDQLKGKVVVLDVWATWCQPCFVALPHVDRAYQKYKSNPKVAFLAVNADDATVTNDQVKESFETAKLSLPIVRDTEDLTGRIFKVEGFPTTIILGLDGTVQVATTGYNPAEDLTKELSEKIDTLLDGKSLAPEVLHKYELEREQYEKLLADALVGANTLIEIPQTKLADRSEPENLKLTRLWKTSDIKAPGNILPFEGKEKAQQIGVIDGSRSVVLLSADGKSLESHDLAIPPTAAVSYLRTGVDRNGRRYFAAFASTQQQLYLFSEDWKLLVTYPESGAHAGIADVQLADLNGDGEPELCVGYMGEVGVQAVSLAGERQWSNRKFENVLHLAVLPPNQQQQRSLICTSGKGTLAILDHTGKLLDDAEIPQRAIHSVYTAGDQPDAADDLCALSAREVGATTVLGISLEDKPHEVWHYQLPEGLHQMPIDMVTHGRLLGDADAQWIIAAPDGSVHILGVDGKLVDRFNYGAELAGLAVADIEGSAALLIASKQGVEALRLTRD